MMQIVGTKVQDIPFNLSDCLVQDGRPDRIEGPHVNMPVELGSTMVFDKLAAFEAARDTRYESGMLYYGRYGNAATTKLEQIPAKLEGADAITLTSSGVAAITTTLMALTHPGGSLSQVQVQVQVQVQTPEAARMKDIFEALKIAHLAQISERPAALSFVLDTPKGTVTLD